MTVLPIPKGRIKITVSRFHETAKQESSFITVNFRGLLDESLQVHKVESCGWGHCRLFHRLINQPNIFCQLKTLALNLPWDQTEFQSIVFDLPGSGPIKLVRHCLMPRPEKSVKRITWSAIMN